MVLLWLPVVFYAISIAYGAVPLHIPMWWPFAIFNQRFGMELLPLFAVSSGIVLASLLDSFLSAHLWKVVSVAAALVVASYTFVWIAKPLCWQEAQNSWQTRRGLDTAVGLALRELPPQSVFLMDIDEHVGILERDGIPLRRVINNEDHRQWVRPKDPQGAWEQALADPAQHVNYVIAFEGDLVDKGVNRAGTHFAPGHSFHRTAASAHLSDRARHESIALTFIASIRRTRSERGDRIRPRHAFPPVSCSHHDSHQHEHSVYESFRLRQRFPDRGAEARRYGGLAELTRRLCDRHNGIGADGVEWLFDDAEADAMARLFNADGSEAEISGNGTRCVAAEICSRTGKQEVTIRTGAGLKTCRLITRQDSIFEFETAMGQAEVGEQLTLERGWREIRARHRGCRFRRAIRISWCWWKASRRNGSARRL